MAISYAKNRLNSMIYRDNLCNKHTEITANAVKRALNNKKPG